MKICVQCLMVLFAWLCVVTTLLGLQGSPQGYAEYADAVWWAGPRKGTWERRRGGGGCRGRVSPWAHADLRPCRPLHFC